MDGKRYVTIPNMSAGFAIIWGAYVAWPYTNLFNRNPVLYGPMLYLLHDEMIVGLVFLVAGLLALKLNILDSRIRASQVLVGLMFAFFSSLFFVGDPATPAGALYGLLAACNLWLAYFDR